MEIFIEMLRSSLRLDLFVKSSHRFLRPLELKDTRVEEVSHRSEVASHLQFLKFTD